MNRQPSCARSSRSEHDRDPQRHAGGRAGTGVAPPRALSLYTPNPMRFEGLGQLVSVRAV